MVTPPMTDATLLDRMAEACRRFVEFWRGPPECPRCRLLQCEAIDTECWCEFADDARRDAAKRAMDSLDKAEAAARLASLTGAGNG